MKIKQIIKTCLMKMGEKDFLDETTLSDQQKEIRDRLVDAFNIAYTDAVTEFMALVNVESVKIVDGEVDCKNLSKQMVYPVKLTDSNGAKHRFRLMPTTITTDFSGNGTLEYAYAPERCEYGDTLDDCRFTADILADGTLGVYYFSLRAFDLSSAYDEAFRSAVKKLKYKGQSITIKERRWGA